MQLCLPACPRSLVHSAPFLSVFAPISPNFLRLVDFPIESMVWLQVEIVGNVGKQKARHLQYGHFQETHHKNSPPKNPTTYTIQSDLNFIDVPLKRKWDKILYKNSFLL